MVKCPYCDAPIKSRTIFCQKCGNILPKEKMLNITIAYADQQFPKVEVLYNGKLHYKTLLNAPETKGMMLSDYKEAMDFALSIIEANNA